MPTSFFKITTNVRHGQMHLPNMALFLFSAFAVPHPEWTSFFGGQEKVVWQSSRHLLVW